MRCLPPAPNFPTGTWGRKLFLSFPFLPFRPLRRTFSRRPPCLALPLAAACPCQRCPRPPLLLALPPVVLSYQPLFDLVTQVTEPHSAVPPTEQWLPVEHLQQSHKLGVSVLLLHWHADKQRQTDMTGVAPAKAGHLTWFHSMSSGVVTQPSCSGYLQSEQKPL